MKSINAQYTTSPINKRENKTQDRKLIDAYFRDFNTEIREYQKARAKAEEAEATIRGAGKTT